jgi:hypothetical protein
MDDFGKLAQQELALRRVRRRQAFWVHLTVWALTSLLLFVIWLLTTPDSMPWFIIPILAWAILIGAHAVWVFGVRSTQEIIMDKERPDWPAMGPALGDEGRAWPQDARDQAPQPAPVGIGATAAAAGATTVAEDAEAFAGDAEAGQ